MVTATVKVPHGLSGEGFNHNQRQHGQDDDHNHESRPTSAISPGGWSHLFFDHARPESGRHGA